MRTFDLAAQDALEIRYDGPIPVLPPITMSDLEGQRRSTLAAADRQDEEADECEHRAANHAARAPIENNCKWRLRQAAAWHDEARKHRQTAAMLRESAARLSARLNEMMADASAQRAAAQ